MKMKCRHKQKKREKKKEAGREHRKDLWSHKRVAQMVNQKYLNL